MASGEIHVGDVGTAFRLTVRDEDNAVVNIAPATLTMLFTKPSKALLTKTAQLTTDGSDGRMQYVTAEGDLDEAGYWKWQGKVAFPSGSFHTDIQKTKVYPNLD